MTRSDAHRRIDALKAVTVDRGATPAEAEVAQRKAAVLEQRFGIAPRRPRESEHWRGSTPPRPSQGNWRGSSRRRYKTAAPFAGFNIPDFHFNVNTGEHSDNVKVHEYRSRGSWRIEIFDDPPLR